MFMGTANNSIDEKNRVIIPSKMRNSLGNRCVVTKGLDKCLVVYTMDDWARQLEKISVLPESDPAIRAFIRHFCANASECELDKQGRIVIPSELKEYGGFKKELVTMGAMSKIEIWAREAWDAPDNDGKLTGEDFAKALATYNY